MGFTSKKRISNKSLFSVFLCLWLHGSNGQQNSFKIYRGERDIFTNLADYHDDASGILSGSGALGDQCSRYGAECYGHQCQYCRCPESKKTFIYDVDQRDEFCKSDENIVQASAPEKAFRLKKVWPENKCLKLHDNPDETEVNIIGTSCTDESSTFDMLWIWTATGNRQLINIKTLECMETKDKDKKVIMKQCKKSRNQKIECNDDSNKMQLGWSYKQLYLHLLNGEINYAISKEFEEDDQNYPQKWTSEPFVQCERSTTYKGCYRFSDGSFMKYLDHKTAQSTLEIRAPIFRENSNCTLKKEFKFYRDGQTEKGYNSDIIFTASKIKRRKIVELKFAKKEQFKAWNGSLLILSVRCEDKNEDKEGEEHCVLLKLESLPAYSDEITNNHSPPTTSTKKVPLKPTSDSETATEDSNVINGQSETSSELSPTSLFSTTTNAEEGARKETSESGGTNSAVIAVTLTLLLLAIVLALGYLIFYKRRKRAQVQQQNKNNDIGVVNYSKEVYEDPNRTYETLDGLSAKQPGTTSDTYSYPDSNIIPNTTPSQQEYTYAKDTDFPRSSQVNAKVAAEGPTSNAGYEAFKQPNDDFYHYPDNTAKAPSTELEYTYAKDTDIPRGNPGTTVGTQDPTNNAVYHTLKQPSQPNDDFYHYPDNTNITKPPSSELEYTYAKDTDFPRITADKRKSAPQTTNNAVYHTLEQPGQTNDDYYHCHENTDSTKPPSSELEYTYAKDTEIPRVTADKRKNLPQTTNNAIYHTLEDEPPTTSPGTKVTKNSELEYANTEFPKTLGNAPPASGALYNTPGQEIPAPIEPEYSYAKNTDMPSNQLPTKQTTNEHSFLPDNNELYHTLEEPNLPQAPVYSTLEGPKNGGPF